MLMKLNHILYIVLVVLSMSACGGGGASGTSPAEQPPQGSSNWDVMVWDQDDWS